MKKQVLIAVVLGSVLCLQDGFAWSASNMIPSTKIVQANDIQQTTGSKSVTEQNRPENMDKMKIDATNPGIEQGPAPVILRIKLVDKAAE